MNQEQDRIEWFDNALIQHGPLNNRIYLMKLRTLCTGQLINRLDKLAAENGYTKIFAKIPAHQAEAFLDFGYQQEASVPGFYHGQEGASFLARYFDHGRQEQQDAFEIEKILQAALQKRGQQPIFPSLPDRAVLRQCVPNDAKRISGLYRKVFDSYPFPIQDPEYIMKTMQNHIVYFGIEMGKKIVALSSAEMDTVSKNVEMTDFATLPEFRGNHFGLLLLSAMEKEMRSRGIQTAYTIARAISPGINTTFARAGYSYSGCLSNNTNISGRIESMNVWYKSF